MSKPHTSTATIERLIVGKAVDKLLLRYTAMRVETGEKNLLLRNSDDAAAILAAALSTDDGEAWLFMAKKHHWVKLVIGNGLSVISDYHLDLETTLKPAVDLAAALEA